MMGIGRHGAARLAAARSFEAVHEGSWRQGALGSRPRAHRVVVDAGAQEANHDSSGLLEQLVLDGLQGPIAEFAQDVVDAAAEFAGDR